MTQQVTAKLIGEARVCPCCGGPVEERIHVDLNTNTMQIGDGIHRLEPKCAEMMKVLIDRYPATVGYLDLAVGMYGSVDGDSDRTESVKVYASKMRGYLDQHGVTLQSVRGRGYRLCPITPYTEELASRRTTPPSERVSVKPMAPPMNVEKEFLFEIFVRTAREYIGLRERSPDETTIKRAFARLKIAFGFVDKGEAQ